MAFALWATRFVASVYVDTSDPGGGYVQQALSALVGQLQGRQ